jgi:hypothetical protein
VLVAHGRAEHQLDENQGSHGQKQNPQSGVAGPGLMARQQISPPTAAEEGDDAQQHEKQLRETGVKYADFIL